MKFRLCTAEEGIRNLEKIIDRILGLITPKKHQKGGKRYWITNAVKNACSKKEHIWKKFKQSKSQEAKNQYKLQNNKTKTIGRSTNYNYYEKNFDKQIDSKGKSF